MPATPAHLMANGTIRSSRFIRPDVSNDFKCLEATANAEILGVAMEGTNYPPLSDLVSTSNAATQGQYMKYYGEGEVCLVEAGAAITRFDKVKADSVGRAVTIASSGTTLQNIGARALQSAAAAGELILVQVTPMRSERPAIV